MITYIKTLRKEGSLTIGHADINFFISLLKRTTGKTVKALPVLGKKGKPLHNQHLLKLVK